MTSPPVEVGGARAANARTPTGGPVRGAAEHAPADEDAPPASSSAPSLNDATERDCERVRMALAEAGYPYPEFRVYLREHQQTRDLLVVVFTDRRIPSDVSWRAKSLAGLSALRCRACYMADPKPTSQPFGLCGARGEGVEDCGVERSAS